MRSVLLDQTIQSKVHDRRAIDARVQREHIIQSVLTRVLIVVLHVQRRREREPVQNTGRAGQRNAKHALLRGAQTVHERLRHGSMSGERARYGRLAVDVGRDLRVTVGCDQRLTLLGRARLGCYEQVEYSAHNGQRNAYVVQRRVRWNLCINSQQALKN